jgi:glutaredoxin/glutathione-dependent peroxiredoxin
MTIAVGDTIPDVEIKTMGPEGPKSISTQEALGHGRVVLFAVPGAFTPGCSRFHLPGFVQGAEELSAKGVDRVACIAVNDAFVMDAWAQDQTVGDKILMLADGNAEFANAVGLVMDGSGFGLGQRSKRYAMVLDDGVVTRLDVDEKGGVDVSSCQNVLAHL